MSEYVAYDTETREFTRVLGLDECLAAIRMRNADNEQRIKKLEEENKRLKDEAYKDRELQAMKQRLRSMEDSYYRGFPISASEKKAIEEWAEKHDAEVHNLTTSGARIKAGGVCGGRYTYHFLPTSIGTSGVIRCHCGAEFEFRELG